MQFTAIIYAIVIKLKLASWGQHDLKNCNL